MSRLPVLICLLHLASPFLDWDCLDKMQLESEHHGGRAKTSIDFIERVDLNFC